MYPGSVSIDLDENGIIDLSVQQIVIGGTDINFSFPTDSYVLIESGLPIPINPSALISGSTVATSNPGYTWTQWPAVISRWDEGSSSWSGTLAGGETAFVGLQFDIDGNNHYGWMKLNLANTQPNSAPLTVVDWAYESTPNTSIVVGAIPEPSTVALLSISSVFLYLARKRNKKTPTSTWTLR